jgi:restriction system protein
VTIIDAIKQVMSAGGLPMTAKEAYDAIVAQNLYEFHAQKPAHVVLMQIRRHSEGIDFPTAAPTKHFRLLEQNKFFPLPEPKRLRRGRRKSAKHPSAAGSKSGPTLASILIEIQDLHKRYIAQLKQRIASDLRKLSPTAFEIFAKELLEVYGFVDTCVTQVSGDGGIDGYGKLRVGLAHLNVAFQCKRWTKSNVQRTEIDKFRGASQGDFEQGIFFATTSFSTGAIGASIKKGAVPIVLVDLAAVVDLMLEKQFGIQSESLMIPTYALDLALTPENRLGGPTGNLPPYAPKRRLSNR